MAEQPFRWTGRVRDPHTVQVDQVIEVPPGTAVDLVASPVGPATPEVGAEERLAAWQGFRATPVSEDDRAFWERLEREVAEARSRTRWREAML
jgi:hypothetical protein